MANDSLVRMNLPFSGYFNEDDILLNHRDMTQSFFAYCPECILIMGRMRFVSVFQGEKRSPLVHQTVTC